MTDGVVAGSSSSPSAAAAPWRPSPREAWLSVAAVFVVALAVRLWAGAQVPFAIPEDTTYYWGVARNLAEGRGFVSDAIWSYASEARDPATGAFGFFFPRAAFEIWLPLPSLLALFPMLLAGSTDYGVTVPMAALVGALVPVITWRIAADVAEERGLGAERGRTLALGAGLVAAVALPLVLPAAHLDSTNPFAVPALLACVLMVRLLRRPPERLLDGRLVLLGVLIGVAGLARNEAAWVGLAWAIVAAWGLRGRRGWGAVFRAVAVPGVVAVAVMAPWLARSWVVFGSPLPGQAITNAWAITGFEIFAWQQPATAAGYLALGPATWLEHRVDGLVHNLVSVLLLPGAPLAFVGLVALPWSGRLLALRPLLVLALVTFLVTTLVFPVQTRWGTFLHASVPAVVLLLVAGLDGLDRFLAWVGRRRGWTRPVAWLGPLFAGVGAVLFLVPGIAAYGAQARGTEAAYVDLGRRMAAAGVALDGAAPVIANHPIWLAEVHRVSTLSLPDEPVASVVDLARAFGAELVVLDGDHGGWPARLASDPDAACLAPVALPPADPTVPGSDAMTAYRVACR